MLLCVCPNDVIIEVSVCVCVWGGKYEGEVCVLALYLRSSKVKSNFLIREVIDNCST